MKILYVDDEEGKREQTKMLLERSNDDFMVDTASSVKNGMGRLDEGDYDVVVSDYDMSPNNGLDFLEEIREERNSDIPFIMFTGKGREEVAMKALNLGADRYVQREGDLETVHDLLSRAIIQEFEHHDEKRKRRLQETYFHDLFETSPDAIVLLDAEDRIIEANGSFEKIFQYDRKDIKGEKVNDLIVPEDKIDEANSVSKKVLSGNSMMIETEREKKDGDLIDVSILGYPIEFEGEQVGVFGIYRDISERKERERKIKSLYKVLSEMESCDTEDEVYEFVLDSAKEILDFKSSSIMMAEGDYLVTKKAIAKNVEVGDKEPIDEGIRGLTYQNNESYLIKDLSEWEEAQPTDVNFQSAISIPIGDEGVFQALSYEKGFFDEFDLEMAEGLIFHTEQILEGIKSRKRIQKSEEKYRTIFECAGDAIFVIKDFEFVDCNRRIEEIFDVQREDILGQNPWDFSPEEQPNGENSKRYGKKMIEEALEGESKFLEWVHEMPDGEKFYTEVSLNKYEVDDEDYVMAVVRDITERKEVQRKLEERNEKIRKLHGKAMDLERCESEDEICELVMEASEDILDFYAGSIDFVEDGEFKVKASIRGVQKKGTTYPIEGVAGKTFRKNESFLIRDIDEVEDAVPKRESYHSAISIPVGDIGVFQALSEDKDDFDERDMELAEILVNHATEAINRLRFEEALKKKNRKIKRLHDTAIDMERCEDVEEVFELTVKAAKEVLGMYDCTLAVIDEENEEFVIKESYRGEYDDDERLPIDFGYLGKTFKNRSSYLIDNILKDDTAKPATDKYKSAISTPIGDLGVFQTMSTEEGYYDEDDLEMAETLLSHTYQVIQRIKGEKELEKSEQRYRSIFENTGTAMVMIEKDRTISLSNKKADRLAGLYEGSVEGRKFSEFVVEDDRDRMERYHSERVKNPESVPNEYDFQLLTKSGDVKDIHLMVNKIPGTEKVVASLMDITEKKGMKKAKGRLESLVQDIDDDFEKIKTYLSSFEPDELNEEQKENIEKIKKIIEVNRDILEDR